jgi:septum formation protein
MPRVYLASRSPRRRLLLGDHGIEHQVVADPLDDGRLVPGQVSPAGWVAALAYLKAAAALRRLPPRDPGEAPVPGAAVVLGADTVVLKDGRVIGQPRDADDARAILHALRAGRHEVLTGVSLIDVATRRREFFVDRAVVRVGPLADDAIDEYVRSGDWRGKAGAYNLAERLAAGWPIDFEGDPTTIMGLPMATLPGRLERFSRACAETADSRA